nr:HAD family phosphatase [Prevotella sp.]
MMKVALFDLDGVVFNTEPQYTIFWGDIFKEYYPEEKGLEQKIKGQTLVQIFNEFFKGKKEIQQTIKDRLNEFEKNMQFDYVDGIVDFIGDLKRNGIKCAVVTSSNRNKMKNVYDQHPEYFQLFNRTLTSEDFTASKPNPDCYLKGAAVFGANPKDCVGFEDSFNGLKAVKAADAVAVGLATTNSKDAIKPLSDVVIKNYNGLDYTNLCKMIAPFQ